MNVFNVVICLVLCLTAIGRASTLRDVPQLADAFEKAEVAGTFVLLDPDEDAILTHNAARANERFIPASTFKIANSLIGLDAGAVSSVGEVLPYGGKPQPFEVWEQDMAIREAIRVSNVPVYQELARRVGLERMRAGVAKLGYGNREIGDVVDRFWLDGPLLISAAEQVEFLHRLSTKALDVPSDVQDAVHEITLQEITGEVRLHGKTGWVGLNKPNIGWYVGWIEKAGKTYSFALNIDIVRDGDDAKRVPLAKECLRLLNKY